ncbi:NADH-dependent alcohol dehydrogenase [Clostridia bacterium]|nr:NADH-dependent alcohol dehydrogenase [Clostridia bacterium]
MKNFVYHTPTKVVFGKNTETQVGELIKEESGKKVLVHYGSESAKKSGLLDRVCDSLKKSGVDYISLGGVVANPRLSKVYEGIDLCKKEGVDFILAVGGGSVIDSAKAISYGVANPGDVWDFFEWTREVEAALPVACILTIAAAGSEMSNSAVITNEEKQLKRGVSTPFGRCRFSILNPELTYTLPDYQVQCGVTDMMMHTMERYFSSVKTMQVTDALAESLLKTIMKNALLAKKNPNDYEAKAELMWAGTLAHNGLTGCGGGGDWATHSLQHELGALFDVAHGAGLAAIWGSWARYVYKKDVNRFVQFAVNVMDVENDPSDPEKTALAGIEAMEKFYQAIGMPIRIKDFGIDITEEQIQTMAKKCSMDDSRDVGDFYSLKMADMIKIYTAAK